MATQMSQTSPRIRWSRVEGTTCCGWMLGSRGRARQTTTDQELVRTGLRLILDVEPDVEVTRRPTSTKPSAPARAGSC
jgi:hypothetical protein